MDSSHQYPAARSAAVSGVGITAIQRSKKASTSAGQKRSQIACSRAGWSHSWQSRTQRAERCAGPLGLPFRSLMPVQPHLRRIREVGTDLDEAGPELRVVEVEGV